MKRRAYGKYQACSSALLSDGEEKKSIQTIFSPYQTPRWNIFAFLWFFLEDFWIKGKFKEKIIRKKIWRLGIIKFWTWGIDLKGIEIIVEYGEKIEISLGAVEFKRIQKDL